MIRDASFFRIREKLFFVIFPAVIPALFFTRSAFAMPLSRIYFEAPSSTVAENSEFVVRLFADTSQPVNAYEFTVSYPNNLLDLEAFDNSHSLINVWQTLPAVVGGSRIIFDGGSFTPFLGTHGELLAIKFRARALGIARFDINSAGFYLADGKGTAVTPQAEGTEITVVPSSVSQPALQGPSLHGNPIPPEIDYLAFIPDPFNSGQKFVGFRVADAGSGVKGAFVRTRSWIFWSDFSSAQNPVALPTNVWAANLKVIDNQGNVSEKTVYDWNAFARGPLWVPVILSAMLVMAIARRKLKS